jgi:hypothetical protein
VKRQGAKSTTKVRRSFTRSGARQIEGNRQSRTTRASAQPKRMGAKTPATIRGRALRSAPIPCMKKKGIAMGTMSSIG